MSAPARRRRPVRRTRPLVLFVDHETRLSGGELDLVDLVAALPAGAVDAHVALPGDGPLADALRSAGCTVHVVAMGEALRGVSRWDLGTRPWRALPQAGEAARSTGELALLARRLRPDVVHSNSMKAHVLAAPAALAAGAPHVWHVRDILEPGWLRTGFASLARAEAAQVIAISEATARGLHGTPAESKVRVVHNGVNRRPVSSADVAAWRQRLGPSPVVGIVGQLARWKGQDVVVEAVALLRSRGVEVRLAVVGTCLFPHNEGAYVDALHERVDRSDLRDHVTFTGAVAPVEPVMAALDVLVHASRLPEPFGRVVVEAMAQGTPVVTTSIGAGPELVPPTAGATVPPDDPEALAGALARLLPRGPSAEAATTSTAATAAAARAAAARFDIARTAAGVLHAWADLDLPATTALRAAAVERERAADALAAGAAAPDDAEPPA